MIVRTLGALLLGGLVLGVTPAHAEIGEVKVRFGLAWVGSESSRMGSFSAEPEEVEGGEILYAENNVTTIDPALGFRVGFEFRATRLIGVDLNALHAGLVFSTDRVGVRGFLPAGGEPPDDLEDLQLIVVEDDRSATTNMTAFSFGVNFHPVHDDNFDFYVGVYGAFVLYGTLRVTDMPEADSGIKPDLAFGGVLGFDWHFGRSDWFFTGSLSYLDTEATRDELGGGETIPVQPWIVNAGGGYRF